MVIKCPLYYIFDRSQHDDLSGPPTDADGKELYYFSRTEKVFKDLRKLVNGYNQWHIILDLGTKPKKNFFCY